MKKWLIYKVISPSGKVYIGQTSKTLDQRRADHEKEAAKIKYKNNAFKRAIRKYKNKLKWTTIENNIKSLALANKREIHWIKHYDSANSIKGYNSTLGGSGVTPNELVKQKISKSVTIANNKRFKDSNELVKQQKIIKAARKDPKRIANLKKTRSSKESRAKTSKDLLKRYECPKAREKLSKSLGGKAFHVYKNEVFLGKWINQAQCAKDLGLSSRGHISSCLNGRLKQYKGFVFVFVSQ